MDVATLLDAAVGLAWTGAGVVTTLRPRARHAGVLLGGVGIAWWLGAVAWPLVLLHRGALAHLLLAYPSGRLGRMRERAATVGFYALALVPALAGGPAWTLMFAAALMTTTTLRFATASGVVKRARAVPLAVAVSVGAVLTAATIADLAGAEGLDLVVPYELVMLLAPAALALDLRTAAWSRATVTRLVVDLGRRPAGGVVRERLAWAIGDPSLVVGYVLDDGRDPVDEAGRPIAMPHPGSGRVVTPVMEDGRPAAVLVHDSASLAEPAALQGAAAALRLAVANVRLQSDVRARAHEVAASTRRLIDVEDAERRRLGGELRERVDPLLADAARALAEARSPQLAQQLAAVREQLRRFAAGLDPVGLREGGLSSALPLLARDSGLPVALSLADGRYAPEVETCAWFVCSEAIANALKHARASHLSIGVAPNDGVLRVEVADDGAGGAQPALGSGLRHLADRVEAGGGRLTVVSPPGEGTQVVAELDVRERG